jgi:hypothetical protein
VSHPAFKGKTITPGKTILETQKELEDAPPKPKAKAAQGQTPAVNLAQNDAKNPDAKARPRRPLESRTGDLERLKPAETVK